MELSDTAVATHSAHARRLLVATALIALTGFAGDFLFWRSEPGVSVGVFIALLGIAVHAFGQRTLPGAVALTLLLATAVQSGVELCFTNVVMLVTLLLTVLGECAFGGMSGLWARSSEAAYAILRGPLRWSALLREWAHSRLAAAGSEHLDGRSIARIAVTVTPAAVVAMIFGILLSAGNAVLADLVSRIAMFVEHWLLDISIARTALWVCWLTIGVAFFWTSPAPGKPRWWTRTPPLWNRSEPTLALWQSIILLVAVNLVFFAANTADAIYLWSHADLPAGVTYSGFVHQGVYSLIVAVVLAGGLLAILFQQQPSVARSGLLRGLALGWVFQNVVLIAGVLRRLQLYVETYQLSELRVYVGCFLLLVSIGFLFLAWHIHHGMSLGRLLGANLIATLGLFFVLQFCDVGTWVGQWNVAQWKSDSRRILDLAYLMDLGPRGWPALAEVARSTPDSGSKAEAERILRRISAEENTTARERDWRAYQQRRESRLYSLLQEFPPLP